MHSFVIDNIGMDSGGYSAACGVWIYINNMHSDRKRKEFRGFCLVCGYIVVGGGEL